MADVLEVLKCGTLSPREIEALTGLSRYAVYDLIKAKQLRAIRGKR